MQETDLYIDLANQAYKLFPSDYTRENMYAVFETRARTAEALGDLVGAKEHMAFGMEIHLMKKVKIFF